jgi:hypothetical protein
VGNLWFWKKIQFFKLSCRPQYEFDGSNFTFRIFSEISGNFGKWWKSYFFWIKTISVLIDRKLDDNTVCKTKNARPQKSFFFWNEFSLNCWVWIEKWKILKEDILKFIVIKFLIFFHQNFLWNLLFCENCYHTPVVPTKLISSIFNLQVMNNIVPLSILKNKSFLPVQAINLYQNNWPPNAHQVTCTFQLKKKSTKICVPIPFTYEQIETIRDTFLCDWWKTIYLFVV